MGSKRTFRMRLASRFQVSEIRPARQPAYPVPAPCATSGVPGPAANSRVRGSRADVRAPGQSARSRTRIAHGLAVTSVTLPERRWSAAPSLTPAGTRVGPIVGRCRSVHQPTFSCRMHCRRRPMGCSHPSPRANVDSLHIVRIATNLRRKGKALA